MPEEDYKYLAFISYSRADNEQDGRRWADWVKQTIEGFEIPINCAPLSSTQGEIPKKSREVFFDRSRLTAGGELMLQLEEHLQKAKYLVLICSPKSAASEFVGFEIDHFKKTGRADKIIPIVVDGKDSKADPRECWVPANLYDIIPVTGEDGNVVATEERYLIYADFRTKEKLPNNTFLVDGGWTEPSLYEKLLIQQNFYAPQELAKRVASYQRIHSTAKYALLGGVFNLEPQQLAGESLLEENVRKGRAIRDTRRKLAILGVFMLIMTAMAAFAYHSYRIAEGERLKSERSLLMIGDAHERATLVMADLLNDLNSKPEQLVDKVAAVTSARQIINNYFDEIDPGASDDESLHMRAVVLNSKGHLAWKTGDFVTAKESYDKAVEIRVGLLDRNGPKPLYLRNVSISHDNLGDLHSVKAGLPDEDRKLEYKNAIAEYKLGLKWAQQLADRPDATPQWNHDVAVGYLKVSGGIQAGAEGDEDYKSALDELKKGLPFAEKAAASDRSYAKWQAELGAYYLALGTLHDILSENEEARKWWSMGQKIFSSMKKQDLANPQYAEWVKEINNNLNPVDEK